MVILLNCSVTIMVTARHMGVSSMTDLNRETTRKQPMRVPKACQRAGSS